jgi:hypothetical protein
MEGRMFESPDFRKWAARVERQANTERDANEAHRLMSIAEYWTRLADIEDWQRDGHSSESTATH